METINLGWIDLLIMGIYIAFVISIGWLLKRYMRTATDFLEAGRSLPAWITGLAFISANLGALEVFGMAASGAKYGIKTVHFYWIGAIPAMIFLAIFMMPFYYGSKARSAPEYLKLRFDEKTRGLNAISFAVMTVFTSGISMFALAELMRILLGWDFNFSLILSAIIVLIYTYLGGLTSAIYNEVLQFFLIVIGFLPLAILGLINVGGWEGLKEALDNVAITPSCAVYNQSEQLIEKFDSRSSKHAIYDKDQVIWMADSEKGLVKYSDEVGSNIFCFTDVGLFSFNKDSNYCFRKYSKVTGLNDVEISAINYSEENNTLIIAYLNGNIDLIRNNSVYSIPDIKRKIMTGEKGINKILLNDSIAYMATEFGIIALDINRKEIKDTYQFGESGTQIKVNDMAFDGEYLYAATEKGIYKANIDSPNLVDYNYWTRLTGVPITDFEYRFITYHNNKLFACYRNPLKTNDDDIFIIEEGSWKLWNNDNSGYYNYFGTHNNYLIAISPRFSAGAYTESWQGMSSASSNPMGIQWFGLIMGLGFVLSFGYWCTNFLVVQRAMAAGSMKAARRTPLIGAIPKMFLPVLVILPGMVALVLLNDTDSGFSLLQKNGSNDFNSVIPMMLGHYFPTGMLGLGITALMASFMSGMAGNVTAFNTVWTYDIYQSYINPDKPDSHYLKVGQFATVFGVLVSIGTAYVAAQFDNIMDFIQLVFAFVNAPLFATFLLGMFWKRSTGNGAFYGLIGGIAAAAIHHGLTLTTGEAVGIKGGWITVLSEYPSEMALSFWTAIWAFVVCFVLTIIVSLTTKRTKSDNDLKGLVYSLTPKYKEEGVKWYQSNIALAILVGAVAVVLSIIFW